MSESEKTRNDAKEAWELQAAQIRSDANVKRSIAAAFKIKIDDDEVFDDLAEMFRTYRRQKAFWRDLKNKGVVAAVTALAGGAAMWVANRYAGRL